MERRSAITAIAVAAGVLVAGSVAAIAVVNAASGTPEPPSAALVVDPAAVLVTSAAPAPSLPVSELPAVPQVAPASTPTTTAPSTPTPAPSPTKSRVTSRSTTAASVPPTIAPRSISADEAKGAVLAQVDGEVTTVRKVDHGGYAAYAVTVHRTDGSTITGYVERETGVVYDCEQTAPPRRDDSQQAGGEHGGEHEQAEHDGEHEGGSGGEHDDD